MQPQNLLSSYISKNFYHNIVTEKRKRMERFLTFIMDYF